MNFEALTRGITPSIGITMLRKGLEKWLKKPVEKFALIYVAKDEQIFYCVDVEGQTVTKPYESMMKDQIIKFISYVGKKKLEAGWSIDMIRLTSSNEGNFLESFVTTGDGKKERIHSKL